MEWVQEFVFHYFKLSIFVFILFVICIIRYIHCKSKQRLVISVVFALCFILSIGVTGYSYLDIVKPEYEQHVGKFLYDYRNKSYNYLVFYTGKEKNVAATIISSEHFDYNSVEKDELYVFTIAKRTGVLLSIEEYKPQSGETNQGTQSGDG